MKHIRSAVTRVIRNEDDVTKAITALGFTAGATLVVLARWWLL